MRIIKPLKLGILHKSWSEDSKNWLCVTTLAFFDLKNPEKLLPEMPQWGKITGALGKGVPFDMAMQKIRGEVLVSGNAYPNERSPTSEMGVGLEIGPINKRLKIYGDRYWKRGWWPLHKITPPEKFSKMPLSYKKAYGGNGFDRNPEGKGYESFLQSLRYKGEKQIPMPNIENPSELMSSIRQRPEPAGLGPLSLSWPQRLKKSGTYDKSWVENGYPHYARDMDWEIFNSATPDQRIDGFFNGTESFALTGLHSEDPKLKGHLPGIQPRSFIKFKEPEGICLHELRLNLDTVWFFPDKNLGVLFYRGKIKIQDSDAQDVDSIMLAYENMVDEPRDIDYYLDAFEKRTNKKTALAHMFNESLLSPVKTAVQLEAEAQEKQKAINHELEIQKETAKVHAKSFFEKSGMEMPPDFEIPEPEPNSIGVVPPEALERFDVDLTEIIENSDKLIEKTKKEAAEKTEEAKKKQQDFLKKLEEQGLLPDEREKIERQKLVVTEKSKRRGIASSVKDVQSGGVENRAEQDDSGAEPNLKLQQFLSNLGVSTDEIQEDNLPDTSDEQLEQAEKSITQARRLAPEPAYPEEPLFPEVAVYLGEVVMGFVMNEESLAGRDLAGADLSGRDFRGMNLKGIMLEQSNLSRAQFDECDLSEAILTGANLTNTSFNNANLQQANLSKTKGEGAIFKNANLSEAVLMNADLPGSDFANTQLIKVNALKANFKESNWQKATLKECIFLEVILNDSDCTGITIEKTIFIKAVLNQAKFRDARFKKVMLIGVDGDNADFQNAILEKVFGGGGAHFMGANFTYAKGPCSGWRTANLSEANFTHAQFDSADFGEANLCNAIMNYGSFKNSIFVKTNLQKAKMKHVNLFKGLLKKTNFKEADLSGANLYAALMLEADFEDTRLDNVLLLKKPIL